MGGTGVGGDEREEERGVGRWQRRKEEGGNRGGEGNT